MTADAPGAPITLEHVQRLADALVRLEREPFDAVLLDLGLPDCKGLEALARIKAAAPNMPVVVYSGHRDEQAALEAVRGGAQDYLLKDRADGVVLRRALRYAIERQRAEVRIQHLAYHDGLTGLPNRRLFFDRLDQALARARRLEGYVAVLFFDLDGFKPINDTLGHLAGDEVLQQVARRLTEHVRDSDTLARLGGDEFALLLPDLCRREDVMPVFEKVRASFEEPFALESGPRRITASIGMSLYPDDGASAEDLLRAADTAMYAAKQAGSRPPGLAPRLNGAVRDPRRLGGALRRALEAGEFEVHYQPRVDSRSGEIVAAEALLRWRHGDEGLLPPAAFLSLAEELGLIVPIGRWILGAACADARRWTTLPDRPPLRVSVNVSSAEFADPGLPAAVGEALDRSGLAPERLELELTESGVMRDEHATLSSLAGLRERGVHLGIDDFGVGYSSLGRLRQVPIDVLKIDRSFVSGLPDDASGRAIVSAIVDMAHGLGLRVVGEGVETPAQRDHLVASQCDELQGFLFGLPEPAAAFEARLQAAARPLARHG